MRISGGVRIVAVAGVMALGAGVGRASEIEVTVSAGFDFRSENVTVVTCASDQARRVVVTVADGLSGGFSKSVTQDVAAASCAVTNTVPFEGLEPARTYRWTAVATAGDVTLGSLSGSFVTGDSADWFAADASGGVNVVSGGEWVATPAIENGRYAVEIDAPAVFNPSVTASGKVASVDIDVTVDAGISEEDAEALPDVEAFAFTLMQDDEAENESQWVARVGGVTYRLGAPFAANGKAVRRTIRVECDDSVAANPMIRFSAVQDGVATVLAPAENGLSGGWIKVDAATIGALGFDGEGSVAGFDAKAVDANVARTSDGVGYATLAAALDADKGEVTLKTNSRMDLAGVAAGATVNAGAYRLVWTDSDANYMKSQDGKYVVKAFETGRTAPANGVPSYVSDALGLDPENAEDKLTVVSEPNSSTDKITLKMNIDQTKIRPGVKVKYQLIESTSPTAAGEVKQEHVDDPAFTVPLSEEGAKVRYFRIRTTVEN